MSTGRRRESVKYCPSLLQKGEQCYLCWRTDRKLDRHEIFGSHNRNKSKEDGLWVLLCHEGCHLGPEGVHHNPEKNRKLRERAQRAAMKAYGWSIEDFRARYGKNYLDEEETDRDGLPHQC